jgi:hypothetical protein
MIIEGVDLGAQSNEQLLELHYFEFERGVDMEMRPAEARDSSRFLAAVEAELVARGVWALRQDV